MATMTCETARQAMMDAELDDLRGQGGSELSVHLRTCAACRTRADAILASYGALARGLDVFQPSAAETPVMRLARRRRRVAWLPLPLAAAAALALLLARRTPDPLPNVDALARWMLREPPIVEPRAGRQAVVIEKQNLTIVWLYEQEKP